MNSLSLYGKSMSSLYTIIKVRFNSDSPRGADRPFFYCARAFKRWNIMIDNSSFFTIFGPQILRKDPTIPQKGSAINIKLRQ